MKSLLFTTATAALLLASCGDRVCKSELTLSGLETEYQEDGHVMLSISADKAKDKDMPIEYEWMSPDGEVYSTGEQLHIEPVLTMHAGTWTATYQGEDCNNIHTFDVVVNAHEPECTLSNNYYAINGSVGTTYTTSASYDESTGLWTALLDFGDWSPKMHVVMNHTPTFDRRYNTVTSDPTMDNEARVIFEDALGNQISADPDQYVYVDVLNSSINIIMCEMSNNANNVTVDCNENF